MTAASTGAARAGRAGAIWVAAAVLGASAAGLHLAKEMLGIHLQKLPLEPPNGLQLHSLPANTERWERARPDEVMSQEVLEELGTQNYLSRLYMTTGLDESGRRKVVDFHAAYYTGMIDTVPHVPERCFVGGGMQISGAPKVVPIPFDMSRYAPDPDVDESMFGEPIYYTYTTDGIRVRLPRGIDRLSMNVTRFKDTKADVEIFAGYFFIANGGVVPRAEDVRALAFNLTDDYAYYTKVQFTSAGIGSPEELAEIAADLLGDLMPELMRRIPDWVEVREGRYPPGNPRGAAPSAG